MNIVVSALNGNGSKIMGRYWRCALKKPMLGPGLAETTMDQFKKFLIWKDGSCDFASAARDFRVTNIDTDTEVNLMSLNY